VRVRYDSLPKCSVGPLRDRFPRDERTDITRERRREIWFEPDYGTALCECRFHVSALRGSRHE